MSIINIRQAAENYKAPPKINELGEIPLEMPIYDDGEGINPETQKPYKYSYMMINDREVRIPESVISQLQEHIKANPSMKGFKVNKKGDGMLSRYTVIPIL